ncbi:MutS protein 1 [Coemansia guatemalensis]|uniref:MutS protein 1 n=1 Tax=Coemansia guatemalensis TaxID=2761395 RepID=A0A9W8HZN6_9FUNG|nr:MutS protein 1 [Coemansia guatemalensis]
MHDFKELEADNSSPAANDEDSDILQQSKTISTSSVLATVRKYRQKYPDSVLLVRVGDFYELYFEQADDIGGVLLGLQVVDKKFRNGTVRFTGFPARSLLRYVEILVSQHSLSVALCEQFQEPMQRSFTRKVTRVITPGTLIDESLANTRVHSYILCVMRAENNTLEVQGQQQTGASAEVRKHKNRQQAEALATVEARRRWEQGIAEAMAAEEPPKRRGRPRKKLAAGKLIMKPPRAPRFDPTTVEALDLAEIEDGNTLVDEADPVEVAELVESPDTEAESEIQLSLAWLDLATGDFMVSTGPASELAADLARIRPREILIDGNDSQVQELVSAANPQVATTALGAVAELEATEEAADAQPPANANVHWPMAAAAQQAEALRLVAAAELRSGERLACEAVVGYVRATQGLLAPLQAPQQYTATGHMRMGAATIQALELVRPLGRSGSEAGPTLLGEIDRTRTSAGARLLAQRLLAPSACAEEIERRLDLVDFFADSRARTRTAALLDGVGDVERAVAKLSLNCGGPHDLLLIAQSLRAVAQIRATLRSLSRDGKPGGASGSAPGSEQPAVAVRRMALALQALPRLAREIDAAIRSDAARDVRACGFLNAESSTEVAQLHAALEEKEAARGALQQQWRQEYSCASLRLDGAALGALVEVTRKDATRLRAEADGGFRLVQMLRTRARFEHTSWTHLLAETDLLRTRLRAEELRAFEQLRDAVLAAAPALRTNSRVLAAIDVAAACATVAAERRLVRPRLAPPAAAHVIANGRHPVVEAQLLHDGRQFVANHCRFGAARRLLLVTGPNMGGKSTFLRQVALVSVLAQAGCFVPAAAARLHVVDAIYARIGARDDVARGQSTFMVEMAETADILRHATAQSLVILDEVGRGTATADGVAIAYATLRHLHDTVRCKALFATHYHELLPHVRRLPALAPLHTAVHRSSDGAFAFLHRIVPGVCAASHALYVAQLAGIPKPVLAVARAFAAANSCKPA